MYRKNTSWSLGKKLKRPISLFLELKYNPLDLFDLLFHPGAYSAIPIGLGNDILDLLEGPNEQDGVTRSDRRETFTEPTAGGNPHVNSINIFFESCIPKLGLYLVYGSKSHIYSET